MTNALTIYGQFDEMQRAAIALHESGYFTDSKSKAQAIVKVMAGAELGIPPFAAMTGIHIIQGKPALGANVLATLIKNDPRYNYRVLEMTAEVCRIQFYENGEPCGISEFTIVEARKAGTKNLDKFPKNMLFARAISNGAKWYTPGIFGGAPVYTPDELGADVDEDGNIIEGTAVISHVKHNGNGHKPAPIVEDGKGGNEIHDAEYEDLAAEANADAEDCAPSTIADIRSGLEEYPRMTGIQVADAAIQTGRYNSRDHVGNTLKKHHEGFKQSGGKLSAGVDRAVALEWFDFLMTYKEAEPA